MALGRLESDSVTRSTTRLDMDVPKFHPYQSYPNAKTVHRRFQRRCENQVIRAALTELANALRDEGSIDVSECDIDTTFASAKGGGRLLVRCENNPTNFLGFVQLAALCILLKQF